MNIRDVYEICNLHYRHLGPIPPPLLKTIVRPYTLVQPSTPTPWLQLIPRTACDSPHPSHRWCRPGNDGRPIWGARSGCYQPSRRAPAHRTGRWDQHSVPTPNPGRRIPCCHRPWGKPKQQQKNSNVKKQACIKKTSRITIIIFWHGMQRLTHTATNTVTPVPTWDGGDCHSSYGEVYNVLIQIDVLRQRHLQCRAAGGLVYLYRFTSDVSQVVPDVHFHLARCHQVVIWGPTPSVRKLKQIT